MAKEYVEHHDRGYYLGGSRISLDSIVYGYLRGESPEGIAESFPAVSLEQVFGAIAFYLANREKVDAYLDHERAEFARLREEARSRYPTLYSKPEAARHAAPNPGE
ncbi:MAG TPA: DUF433 domain-containing protein [Bryobacteraceae bacterium]|jgi:hypothetical protein